MGKFDSKNKNSQVDIYRLIAERNAASAAKQTRQAPQQAAPQMPQEMPQQMRRQPQQMPQQPYGQPQQAYQPYPQQAYPQQPVPQPAEPKRRGPRVGSLIFYTFYFLLVFVILGGLFMGLTWVKDFLVKYEAGQPDVTRDQLYAEYFADPDWGELYDMAGVEKTTYEGRDEYIAYMEAKVDAYMDENPDREEPLEMMETSAGLSGDKKYILKLGKEKVASFTMNGAPEKVTDIADWQLGTVEVFFEGTERFRISKADGHTAYVNGVALNDDFTIQIASTIADDYLPMGLTGSRTCVQEIGGLLVKPTVTVTNEKGEQMEVTYDETTRTFVEQTTANTIGEEEKTFSLKAVETYALFMIEKAKAAEVAKYFQKGTDTYNTIVKSEVWWTQRNNGAAFSEQEVTGYARYSEDLFSVRVSMSLDVTRTDGSIKKFPVSTTLFVEKQGGKWLVTLMTNVDVQQPRGQVRLTFKNGEEILTTGFVANDVDEIQTPMISAPEGKVFAGWALESVDENGVKTLTIVFGPTENGVVELPAGTVLEPMTLFAHFENA